MIVNRYTTKMVGNSSSWRPRLPDQVGKNDSLDHGDIAPGFVVGDDQRGTGLQSGGQLDRVGCTQAVPGAQARGSAPDNRAAAGRETDGCGYCSAMLKVTMA